MAAKKSTAELRGEALQAARHAADLRLIAEGLIKRAKRLQQTIRHASLSAAFGTAKDQAIRSDRRAAPNEPVDYQLRMWRRRHVSGVIAEVAPVPGIGSWEACAWSVGAPKSKFPVGGSFSLLTDAQEAGDNLACARMAHDCSLCERWVPIERRNRKR